MTIRAIMFMLIVLSLGPYAVAQEMREAADKQGPAFPETLLTENPEEGFALAIKLSRLAVKATQPDIDVLKRLRPVYAENADSLIAVSQVVAINFQTIAGANGYWRVSKAQD